MQGCGRNRCFSRSALSRSALLLGSLLLLSIVLAEDGSCNAESGNCADKNHQDGNSQPPEPQAEAQSEAKTEAPPKADSESPQQDQSKSDAPEQAAGSSLAKDCGSCYGAEDHAKGRICCNTCAEVKMAYREKNWGWPGNEGIAQCKNVQEATPASCAAILSCDECLVHECAWCIGSRRCVEDKAWMCSGENDHVGRIGTVKSCPSRAESAAKASDRKKEEAAAEREHRARLGEGEDVENARARAKEKLEARQQEELERLRGEESAGESLKNKASEEEIRRRAAQAGEGEKDPYGTLGVDYDAQMTDIRKAYRKLSLLLHPDKVSNPELKELAQLAFMDVVTAYEVLGDPEKRAAFDDMGGEDQAQFNTFWEWEMYGKGKQKANDFYNGEKLISKLTAKLWPRRVKGDSIWLVEFYAPWCSACGNFVSQYKEIAKLLENDKIEVGAVNCENEKMICSEWFSIQSYPTLMIVGSAERGTQQLYSQKESKSPSIIVEWARLISAEWIWLYSQAHTENLKSELAFKQEVLESEDLWFIIFTDGVYCGPCRSTITNGLRLSAGVHGLAKVGVVDCEEPELHDFCFERMEMPNPPFSPQVRIFKIGPKNETHAPGYLGEMLFNGGEIPNHLALQMAEMIARNALADRMPKSALSMPKPEGYEGPNGEDDGPPEQPPPRPPPQWNGPDSSSQPRGIAWGGSTPGLNRGTHRISSS